MGIAARDKLLSLSGKGCGSGVQGKLMTGRVKVGVKPLVIQVRRTSDLFQLHQICV